LPPPPLWFQGVGTHSLVGHPSTILCMYKDKIYRTSYYNEEER
jgi:hypothetical protein